VLKAEMYVVADLTENGQPPQGVEVPTKALFLAGDDSFVFVEDAPGRFRRQRVTVGPEQAGRIAVLDGLAPGQRVITDGSLLLKEIIEAASVG
jgi:cobalt-zinc-cadmium efflux system membrane fusion protein